jgi:hypothetical protein
MRLHGGSCMNDLAQFQPAFNGVNTLLAVSTNVKSEQITNGNLKLKGNGSFHCYGHGLGILIPRHENSELFTVGMVGLYKFIKYRLVVF